MISYITKIFTYIFVPRNYHVENEKPRVKEIWTRKNIYIYMNKNFDWAILIIVVINPELLGLPPLIFNIILKQKLEKIFVAFFNAHLFSLWNCDLSWPWTTG